LHILSAYFLKKVNKIKDLGEEKSLKNQWVSAAKRARKILAVQQKFFYGYYRKD